MTLTPLVSAPPAGPSASPSAGRARAGDIAPDQLGQHPDNPAEGTPAERFSALVRQHLTPGSPAADPGEDAEVSETTPLPTAGDLGVTASGMAGLPVVAPQAAPAPSVRAGAPPAVTSVVPPTVPEPGQGAPVGRTVATSPAVTTGPALAATGQTPPAGPGMPETSGTVPGRAPGGAALADDPATVTHAGRTVPAGESLVALLSAAAGTSPAAGASPTDGATRSAGAGDVHQVTDQVFPEVTRLVSRGDGTHRLTLRLHPADLGEVKVVLSVKDGVVDVALSAGAAAREALREGSPQLRSLLETVGVTPGQVVIREAGSPSSLPSTGSSGSSNSQLPLGTGQPPGQGDAGDNLAHRGPGGGAATGQDSGSGTGSPADDRADDRAGHRAGHRAGQRADNTTDRSTHHRAGLPSGAVPDRATRRLDLDL